MRIMPRGLMKLSITYAMLASLCLQGHCGSASAQDIGMQKISRKSKWLISFQHVDIDMFFPSSFRGKTKQTRRSPLSGDPEGPSDCWPGTGDMRRVALFHEKHPLPGKVPGTSADRHAKPTSTSTTVARVSSTLRFTSDVVATGSEDVQTPAIGTRNISRVSSSSLSPRANVKGIDTDNSAITDARQRNRPYPEGPSRSATHHRP